ncbi:MAG TPA: SGNH/GDSL hydrolase family protein [Candidatus Paceibacterota bacterium]|nr:SGNH/GDSL hydrolase family protein [Verrucomicrobiota bacterium]HRY48799.1 SGNH/GDSL hydrolase family protein [Candidatus Paceibacterota bacterium]HRZ99485.1 SGNH/GDSL hydrolase family protein [Candidatus Paceibacterota bacterium]
MKFSCIFARIAVGLSLLWLSGAIQAAAPAQARSPSRWERDIQAFERQDQIQPPPPHAVLFLGSSSIRLWTNLAQDFPKISVINRGFGGSYISDSVHYFHRIVLPYRPRLIVFYAGTNDINDGKSPEQVLVDFQELVALMKAHLPQARLAFIAMAPNPARWAKIDQFRAANRLIRNYTRRDNRLVYVDVHSAMLDRRGKPLADIFVKDQLHMNGKGYEIWRQVVGRQLNLFEDPRNTPRLKGAQVLSLGF